MDGQENPLTNIVGANFQEVQKYLSLTGHVYSPTYLTSGAQTWEKLPDDVKAAVTEVAASVQDWALEQGETADNELVDKVRAAGVEIITDIDKTPFIEAMVPVYQKYVTSPKLQQMVADIQATE